MESGEWNKEWMKYLDLKQTLAPNNAKKAKGLKPCILQFANCDRLEANDAVYIFDEVGAGKTVNAGLMALHYLYNHERDLWSCKRDVLVITDNALVKSTKACDSEQPRSERPQNDCEDGQFRKDCLNRLPFKKMGLEDRITVINNQYSSIRKVSKCWGLVIIDEAHVFLSRDTQRYRNLVERIRANKIVFLTATPVKNGPSALNTYVKIARAVTEKEDLSDDWIQAICTGRQIGPAEDKRGAGSGESGRELPGARDPICSKFDPSYPVTRYFKDTVDQLMDENQRLICGECGQNCRLTRYFNETTKLNDGKKSPVRRFAEVWICGAGSGKQKNRGQEKDRDIKNETLLAHINRLYEEDPQNRFLIFVRYVEKEAKKLEEHLLHNGFSSFDKEPGTAGVKTVKRVTGDNSWELSKFKSPDPKDLPTVLIVTYQVAEQGVNLPGFNHVINYHIPASPSALEQRYGRIDRLDSQNESIYIYYLILPGLAEKTAGRWDASTVNFYHALRSYIRDILTCLPSRNVILTKELFDWYDDQMEDWAGYKKDIGDLVRSDEFLERTLDRIKEDFDSPSEESTDTAILEDFIKSVHIEVTKKTTVETLRKKIYGKIRRMPKELSREKLELARVVIEKTSVDASAESAGDPVSNKIFYLTENIPADMDPTEVPMRLDTIDARLGEKDPTPGCAARILSTIESAIKSGFANAAEPKKLNVSAFPADTETLSVPP